jgi:XTP/dITP diphosphohydrolase
MKTLKDDSWLAVDALDGAPSVCSARFAGPNAAEEDSSQVLIDQMAGIADRRARFVSVIALARRGQVVKTFRGEELLSEPREAMREFLSTAESYESAESTAE